MSDRELYDKITEQLNARYHDEVDIEFIETYQSLFEPDFKEKRQISVRPITVIQGVSNSMIRQEFDGLTPQGRNKYIQLSKKFNS